MTANEIRAFFAARGVKVKEIALAIREARTSVSNTINYIRLNARIRKKLETHYGIAFDDAIPVQPAAERKAA